MTVKEFLRADKKFTILFFLAIVGSLLIMAGLIVLLLAGFKIITPTNRLLTALFLPGFTAFVVGLFGVLQKCLQRKA
jgi:hypothetical protein